jgi:hypothetical protein
LKQSLIWYEANLRRTRICSQAWAEACSCCWAASMAGGESPHRPKSKESSNSELEISQESGLRGESSPWEGESREGSRLRLVGDSLRSTNLVPGCSYYRHRPLQRAETEKELRRWKWGACTLPGQRRKRKKLCDWGRGGKGGSQWDG